MAGWYADTGSGGDVSVTHNISAAKSRVLLDGQPIEAVVYPRQIAFNALPQIDMFLDNGYTKEEMKVIWETRKILGDERIRVNPTTVRVPVVRGHSEAAHVEFRRDVDVDAAGAAAVPTQAMGDVVAECYAELEAVR